jgi:hypothetical protein
MATSRELLIVPTKKQTASTFRQAAPGMVQLPSSRERMLQVSEGRRRAPACSQLTSTWWLPRNLHQLTQAALVGLGDGTVWLVPLEMSSDGPGPESASTPRLLHVLGGAVVHVGGATRLP